MSSSRTEVHQMALPNKSPSEIPTKSSRVLQHHHHLHRRDKSPQPADPQLRSSLDVPKSEAVDCIESRSVSRQPSILGPVDGSSWMMGWQRPLNDWETKAEKERSAMCVAELRNSFLRLNKTSIDTTRRLDTAYYSVHEKLDTLHNIITSLKNLAQGTNQLNDDFKHKSQEIVTETEVHLDSFENFCGQEKEIKELQKRIEAGRETVRALGARVEVVKRKVEGWEKVEIEWQQRTRKRLKILWAFMGLVILTFVLFLIFQYTPTRAQAPDVLQNIETKNGTRSFPGSDEKLVKETLQMKPKAADTLGKLRQEDELGDDPRLRGFDEL